MSLEHNPARQGGIDAMSIKEFCRRNDLSEPFYYALQKRGLGPDVIRIGGRTLISTKAAARWREANERKSAAPTP
jgi:hypothetical protein